MGLGLGWTLRSTRRFPFFHFDIDRSGVFLARVTLDCDAVFPLRLQHLLVL
jgi:hypothetical protein